MKLLAFIAIFFCCLSAFAQVPRAPTNWEPILAAIGNEGKIYIDKNSITTDKNDSHRFVSAGILFVPTVPITIQFNNKNIVVTSFARMLIISCKDKIMSPSVDLFFDVKMPKRTDKALGGINYPGTVGTTAISENSTIYKRFCDPYI